MASLDDPPPTAVSRYDVKSAVKLPEREDPNEWIAYNLSEFNTQVSMLYSTICGHCTRDKCPEMLAGTVKYVFTNSKDETVEKSAPEYIEHSLDWVQEQIDDQDIFPSASQEKEFPDNFPQICKAITKLLIAVFAHVIHHHMAQVKQNKDEAHMNTSLKHFIYFAKEFELITDDEIEPIREYIEKLPKST